MDRQDSSVYYKCCYVFVDDSNLWIEGQRYGARRQKLSDADRDPRFRVDLGKFLDLVVGKRSVADAFLYGSKPPPNDSVWAAARKKNFTVSLFDRAGGVPYGREKQVDMAMGTQITKSACKCDPGEKDRVVFVIVTGDRDFSSPVQCALDEGIQVELWAWKNAMSIHFRQLAHQEVLLTVQEIDNIAERFSFTAYRSTRARGDIDPAHAIVFKGIPNKHKVLESFTTDLFCLLRLFYITPLPSSEHDQLLQDIVVEFPNSKPEDVLKQLERCSFDYKAISYPEYIAPKAQAKYEPAEISMSNRYQILGEIDISDYETAAEAITCSLNLDVDTIFLPKLLSIESSSSIKGNGEVDVEDDDEEVDVDTDWEVHVRNKAGAMTRRHKLREKRCRWEIHCAKASACTYLHTEEEKGLFKNYPQVKFQFWKTRPCNKTLRHSKVDCPFAHTDSDTWCLKCRSWGHSTDACAG